jgi:hypothetical protein
VFGHSEYVELFVRVVPVRPDALKRAGSVIERVGHDADLGVFDGYELAFKESVLGHYFLLFIETFQFGKCFG